MTRGFRDESHLVPVFFGESAGGVEILARRRREATENVHLSHFGRDGFHVFVGVGAATTVVHAAFAKIPIRNGHVPAVGVIGRGAEEVACFVETQPPGVVGGIGHHLHVGAVGSEAVKRLAEVEAILAAEFSFKTRITHRPVHPVIETVVQVRGSSVGVERAEASEEYFFDVGLVVAIGILQKQHVRGLRDDEAAVGERQTRRDAQSLGEAGELVGLAVVVGVFADQNIVASTVGLALIGVVFGDKDK